MNVDNSRRYFFAVSLMRLIGDIRLAVWWMNGDVSAEDVQFETRL